MSPLFRKQDDRKRLYDASYYSSEGAADSQRSAEAVVPVVASFVEIGSVVDVGCGAGAWLAVFREHGAKRILGLDGDHIDPAWIRIPPDCFRAMDLSKPFRLDEEFDLAVSLEVAEHLPKKCAADLVESLVRLAPIILFSAAIPFQGGTYHVNEQWPPYWQTMFARHDYRMLDLVRKEIWKRPEIKYWYRQNIFLFVREGLIPSRPCFQEAIAYPDDLLLVHPDILQRQMGVSSLLKHLPGSVWRAARHLKQRFLSTS
jgi:SAM-dependent methyltransferase